MKSVQEQVELLRAAIVLAAADGKISASERGLLEALASRIGVGEASLNAMVDRAKANPAMREELFHRATSEPELTMELLVAAARLDGDVSNEERDVLVHIMNRLGMDTDEFAEVFLRGVQRADTLRKARFK